MRAAFHVSVEFWRPRKPYSFADDIRVFGFSYSWIFGFLFYIICLRVLTHLHMSFASPAFLLPLLQVYPVDGGMEDWSYAAGWEQSPQPISVCRPTTYGGYAEDRR